MYEDSWYSFVPEVQHKRGASTAQAQGHRRRESLLQQPNGAAPVPDSIEPLGELFEEDLDRNSPPEATVVRRASSYSDFYDIVRAHLSKEGPKKRRKKKRPGKNWDALALPELESGPDGSGADHFDASTADDLLMASQQEYLLYRDQLAMTERHLDSLIDDTNSALRLLEGLSESFQAVEDQTTSFQSQCDDLLSEQKRLQTLADEVGTELHYYAYLENVTRRLNAPGASRLVDDDAFGEILDNLDSCIAFMTKNPAYRDAESYQARYQALLTKALHLLEVGFTNRLEKVSAEISKQIAGTQSESARHALAYGRFEEMMTETYSLIPNVQKVVKKAYDDLGNARQTPSFDVYSNTANNLFQSYLALRDRDLKPISQHDLDAFKADAKSNSVETASRNFVKQCLESSFNEALLFTTIFSINPRLSADANSAYAAMKSHQRATMNGTNITPLATNLQLILQSANLHTVCNVVGWITNEYAILEYDEDETQFMWHCRQLTGRLLTDHLWTFADAMFEAEIAKSISRTSVAPEALKIGPVVNGVASSNAYPPVKRALELLVMFDQAMPKERCQRNSPVVFKIVRESIQALRRAETRIKSSKNGTDPDLFMIKNLLILKNELVSLEIGDVRGGGGDGQDAGMQHFGQIWDALSPLNWIGFLGSFIPGSLWGGASAPAPAAGGNARAGTTGPDQAQQNQDASEQLDDLLRQSIYAFTQRWGTLVNDARKRRLGAKSLVKVERELEDLLQMAFSNQPEVVSKLKEAIQINAQAQDEAKNEGKGGKGGKGARV